MARERSGGALLSTLDAEHAEWRPLLSLVEAALGEMKRPVWSESVPAREHSAALGQPLLSGVIIQIAPDPVRRWIHRAMTIAGAGASAIPFVDALAAGRLDPLALFEAAVAGDPDRLEDLAGAAGDDRGVLKVVAPILAMPMLHACRRAWTPLVPAAWAESYCPICGDWPTLAETRGLDGQRRLRCGRCGGDWRTERLRCPFCQARQSRDMVRLVAEGAEEGYFVEACLACRGYLKGLDRRERWNGASPLVEDWASPHLDYYAAREGYWRATPSLAQLLPPGEEDPAP